MSFLGNWDTLQGPHFFTLISPDMGNLKTSSSIYLIIFSTIYWGITELETVPTKISKLKFCFLPFSTLLNIFCFLIVIVKHIPLACSFVSPRPGTDVIHSTIQTRSRTDPSSPNLPLKSPTLSKPWKHIIIYLTKNIYQNFLKAGRMKSLSTLFSLSWPFTASKISPRTLVNFLLEFCSHPNPPSPSRYSG